jgi:hypothetical protein
MKIPPPVPENLLLKQWMKTHRIPTGDAESVEELLVMLAAEVEDLRKQIAYDTSGEGWKSS